MSLLGSGALWGIGDRLWAQPSVTAPPAPTRGPKRLIICADGTWNEAERNDPKTGRPQPTNVLKAARAVLPRARDGTEQVVFYHVGVGTDGGLDEFTGGAFGAGLEVNVRAMYRFLSHNYAPGDEIYMFGFSRGALTVRTLCGLLGKAYLLEKDDEYYTPHVYRMYEGRTVGSHQDVINALPRLDSTPAAPMISFVGVWDTVGSLGAPGFLGQLLNRDKYAHHDIELNGLIRNAYHALAIDECRKPFLPSLWKRPSGWTGNLEQAWFAGVHSNVGGSYSPDGLANEALHWMVEKAEKHGLEFDAEYLGKYRPCFNSTLNDSMSTMYRVMGSVRRDIGTHLEHGEMIHQSALDRMRLKLCNYQPPNLASFLEKHAAPPVATTTRLSRGHACPPRDAPQDPPNCPAE